MQNNKREGLTPRRVYRTLAVAGMLACSGIAEAHYLWLERDAFGPAKAYFGEWQDGLREKKGGVFDKLKGPKAFLGESLDRPLEVTKGEDHFVLPASGKGDVRATEDSFASFEDKRAGGRSRYVFVAKEGRTETKALLDLELVPVEPGGNTFILWLKGKPVAEKELTVFGPPKWAKTFHTDKEGKVTIRTPWKGRYVVETQATDASAGGTDAARYDRTHYIATLSFIATEGQSWTE